MSANGKLHHGGEAKSALVKEVTKYCKLRRITDAIEPDCIVIDGMALLHSWKKPTWVLTGNDLGIAFCQKILEFAGNSSIVILCFDTYLEDSLKSVTWEIRSAKVGDRKAKSACRYDINGSISLSKVNINDLLGHTQTKRSLTQFLIAFCKKYFADIDTVSLIVAGNGYTYSAECVLSNNHEEGDTLIIHCLCAEDLKGKTVVVHANDTDIFVLLVRHLNEIDCNQLYMQLNATESVDITAVSQVLDVDLSSVLMSVHCITGCDTVGKFAGKTKEKWIEEFLKLSTNSEVIKALIRFQNEDNDDTIDLLEQFICSVYNPSTKLITRSLRETRYALFNKNAAECEKLPPTKGSFIQHMKRAYRQLTVWQQAPFSIIKEKDPLEFGWEKKDDTWIPKTTDGLVASVSVIELVSCGCKGTCLKNHCSCQREGQNCTDFCSCGDLCENMDPKPSLNTSVEETNSIE